MPTEPAIAAALLKKFRKTPASRSSLREFTTLLSARGLTYADAARLTGVSARSARRWLQAYKKNGDSGLQEKPPVGRPARLTQHQTDAIRAVIRELSPRAVGLDSDEWTGKTLSDWLRREFSTSITDRRARQILTLLRNK